LIVDTAGGEVLADMLVRLRHLEDMEAIRTLLATIARGTDRYDGALLAAAIHEDATMDMGGAPMTGAAFARALKAPAAPRPGRMHVVANARIEVEGDAARSESHIVSCQDVMVDGIRKTRIRAGRYLDRWERRSGAWKLAARMLVDEWGRIDPVGEAISPGRHLGSPAPDDLSYAL
jgi:hypothetical protein